LPLSVFTWYWLIMLWRFIMYFTNMIISHLYFSSLLINSLCHFKEVNYDGSNYEFVDIHFILISFLLELQIILILNVVTHADEIRMPLKHSFLIVEKLPNTAVIFQIDVAVVFVEQFYHIWRTWFVRRIFTVYISGLRIRVYWFIQSR
jgi:hypothetical protein